jgi:hypothetical protein
VKEASNHAGSQSKPYPLGFSAATIRTLRYSGLARQGRNGMLTSMHTLSYHVYINEQALDCDSQESRCATYNTPTMHGPTDR